MTQPSTIARTVRTLLLSAALLACAPASFAADDTGAAAPAPDAEIEAIVVTARYREESSQDVPIPITVIGAADLARDGNVTLQDLVKTAPGLQATTPNSRRTGISLRGIGKSAGNDALEASMGVLVDGVYLTHPGMTYLDFTDLERIEVLRGPQGTLLGKNTTVGALNYVTRTPAFEQQASTVVTLGERNTRAVNASYNDAIVADVLAYRASVFFDKQDGYIGNINGEGGTTSEKNRAGGRLQFLWQPVDGLSARLAADYAQTNERSNTKPVIQVLSNYDDVAGTSRVTTPGGTAVPTTAAQVTTQNSGTNTYTSIFNRGWFGGYRPIVGSWTQEDLNLNVPVLTTNQGVSGTVDWDLGVGGLTFISAVRKFEFDAKNDADQTKFDTGRNGSRVDAGQTSHELRFSSKAGGTIDYTAGLYFLHNWNTSSGRSLYGADSGAYSGRNGDYNVLYPTAAGKQLLQASLNRVYVLTTITPDTRSYAGFGQVNWHVTDRATLTVGARETYEKKTSTSTKNAAFSDGLPLDDLTALGTSLGATPLQIAAANNLRRTTVGTTYATAQGTAIDEHALSWLVSPTFQLTDDVLLFASAASGEKSGSVQFTSTGAPLNVEPEKVLDFELGVKSLLFSRSLQLNANLFQARVKGYQQTTSSFDAATTALRNDGQLYYSSNLGNIPEIRARGVELEAAWSPLTGFKLRLGGTYNDAEYTDWRTATCASELNVRSATAVCDNTGKQIVAAPKFTVTAGVDYRLPLGGVGSGHVWVNQSYRTKQNFDNNLSRYGVQDAYGVTDVGVGLISLSERFEVDVIAKNLFDEQYTTSVNVGSDASIGYDGIGDPRWIGLMLHAKL